MPGPLSIFIIDPPERLAPRTDTTLALMRESLARGHRSFYCTPADLSLDHRGAVRGEVRPIAFDSGEELFRAGEPEGLDLGCADVVYMRKDPPVDAAYLHTTWLLDRLPPRVLQVNPARALRSHCEKLIPLYFPGLAPATLVSRSAAAISRFLDQQGKIVIKPLDDCSGRGIVALETGAPDLGAAIDRATLHGERLVQAQRFLPEIAGGDKRVLLLGGEILGWVRRMPAAGEFRSNVNAGGHCLPCDLDEFDLAICARLKPWLLREGIVLAGVDIVGRHVLEVNITSPSCLREMNELTEQALEGAILDHIGEILSTRGEGRSGVE